MANKLTIVSLGGRNINDGVNYRSKFLAQGQTGDTFVGREVIAEVLGEFPEYVRSQPEGRVLPLAIELVTRTWSNLKQLRSWVNPRQGPLELRATDEGGNTLRVMAKPVSLRSRDGTDWLWELLLWVSRPIWENVTETDTTQTITTSGQTWVVDNVGSDEIRPRVTITPVNYKPSSSAPLKMRHVVVANRSPLPLTDALGNPYPVELTNGGWDVEALISAGQLHPQGYDLSVYVNGVRVPRYLSNWGAGIGPVDAPEGYNLAASTVRLAIRFRLPGCSEQETNAIWQLGFSLKKAGSPTGTLAFEIRNDANGTPGSVIATSQSYDVSGLTTSYQIILRTFSTYPSLKANTWYWAAINASALNASGINFVTAGVGTGPYEGQRDPTRLSTDGGATWTLPSEFINHHLVFRAYTQGTAKVWAPLLLPASLQASLAQGLKSTDPQIVLSAGGEAFPDRGCVLIDNEAIVYNGKAGDRLTIAKRGARGTTAVDHNEGAAVYFVDADVRLVFGQTEFSGLSKPYEYEPRGAAPVIDGVVSTNDSFTWIGPFLSRNALSRPMTWAAEFDDAVPQADAVSLDFGGADTALTWKDAPAKGSYATRNAVRQQVAPGIAAQSDGISLDLSSLPETLAIEHLLTNEWGEESLVKTHRKADVGVGRLIEPTDEAYVYRMRTVRDLLAGTDTPASPIDVTLYALSTEEVVQTFTLEAEATIYAVALYLKKSATLSAPKEFVLIPTASDGTPDDTQELSERLSVTDGELSTSYQWIVKSFSTPVSLPAGTYGIKAIAGTAGQVVWGRWSGSVYARGSFWKESQNVYGNQQSDLAFRVLGRSESGGANATESTAVVDNVRLKLDPARTPRVLFQAADVNVYVLDDAVLENVTTGQKVTLRALLQTGESLDLDFETLAVTNSDDDLSRPEHAVAIVEMDEADPFRLASGSNTLKWTDPGVSNTQVRTRFFARYL